MSTAIIVAIVAMLSTIVGATIGAATTYILAVRRERADRERNSRSHAIEIKRAARLIDAELLRAQSAAAICVEKRRWWSVVVQPLSTEAWQKYNGTIDADLSNQAWLEIVIAAEAVENIRDVRIRCVADGLPLDAISDAIAEQISPILRDIARGRDALAPFVSDSHRLAV